MTDSLKVKTSGALGLFGTGGFAREVMPLARAFVENMNTPPGDHQYATMFVDLGDDASEINGCPIVTESMFFASRVDDHCFNVATSNSKIRSKVANLCSVNRVRPLTLISDSAVIYDNNEIGEGSIICAHSTITSNTKVGKFFQSNIYSYVGHDCVIADFVTFAPRVSCNGNTRIGKHAYIGTGAMLKQGTRSAPLIIGEGAVVGMGAVVTRDVEPFTTVIGNPAQPYIKTMD